MNVYDFDNTIYRGDSTVDFLLWLTRKRPVLLRSLPGISLAALKIFTGKWEKTEMKQAIFSVFSRIEEIDVLVEEFWEEHFKNIKEWYLAQKRTDDVVASASPVFLIRPACEKLGLFRVIASDVDPETGIYKGKNCDGEEKVRRFFAAFPNAHIDRFYSDSLSDAPLARLADTAYLVRGETLTEWP